ncbi:MAG: sulfite exporter TauE/SafE family protein [Candidatus Kapaibacteriales bacterium]
MLGGAASLHCVAMCGPIALMLPHKSKEPISIIGDNLSYNLGRATTYAALGLIIGYFGTLIGLDSLQRTVSIAIGATILISYAVYKLVLSTTSFGAKIRSSKLFSSLTNSVSLIKKPFNHIIRRGGKGPLFLLGLLNGLLPCGMVYAALSIAFLVGSPVESAQFMGVYGLGTFPAMTALYLLPSSTMGKLKSYARKAFPAVVILVASMMMLRGMALGIPYLSPEAPSPDPKEASLCEVE